MLYVSRRTIVKATYDGAKWNLKSKRVYGSVVFCHRYIFSSRYRLRFSCSVSWRTWKASMNDICFAQTPRLRSVLLSPSPGGEDHLNGLNLKKEASRVRLKINFNKTFNYWVSIFEPGLAFPNPNLAIRYCFCLSSKPSSYISEINFTGFRHSPWHLLVTSWLCSYRLALLVNFRQKSTIPKNLLSS